MLKCDQVPTVCTLAAGTVVGITHMVLLFSLPETSNSKLRFSAQSQFDQQLPNDLIWLTSTGIKTCSMSSHQIRPNKNISVFQVTGMNILGRVGTHIFFILFF